MTLKDDQLTTWIPSIQGTGCQGILVAFFRTCLATPEMPSPERSSMRSALAPILGFGAQYPCFRTIRKCFSIRNSFWRSFCPLDPFFIFHFFPGSTSWISMGPRWRCDSFVRFVSSLGAWLSVVVSAAATLAGGLSWWWSLCRKLLATSHRHTTRDLLGKFQHGSFGVHLESRLSRLLGHKPLLLQSDLEFAGPNALAWWSYINISSIVRVGLLTVGSFLFIFHDLPQLIYSKKSMKNLHHRISHTMTVTIFHDWCEIFWK